MRLLFLALAGSLGTLARYGVSLAAQAASARTGIPIGTLSVNVVGSFLLGYVASVVTPRIPSEDLRLVAGLGFLGAFTTFSTFELDCLTLLERGSYAKFGIYASANLLIGFGALVAGRALAGKGLQFS